MDFTTAEAVKRQLGNIQGTVDSTTIQDIVTAYSAEIENYLNQKFSLRTVTAEENFAVVDNGGRLLVYPECPLISSITAASWSDGYTSTVYTIDTTQLHITNRPNGAVVRWGMANMRSRRGGDISVTLSYTGGYADSAHLPPDLEFTARQLCAWAYQVRSAPITSAGTLEMGIIKPPGLWPTYICNALASYRRYYMH